MKSIFPETVKKARLDKGLTQQELANMLGVARATVIAWEKGKYYPSNDQLASLENALGFDLGHLYKLITARGKCRAE